MLRIWRKPATVEARALRRAMNLCVDLGFSKVIFEGGGQEIVEATNAHQESWTTYGLCENGRLKEAVDLFEEMVSKEQVLLDALTYNVLINGFYRVGKVYCVRKMMEFMRKNGCTPHVFNYSTLVNGFCKDKKLLEAKEVFDEKKSFRLKPDTISYSTLINCFCRAGKIDEATEFLKEMKEKECKADTVTFNVILGGLCREDWFEKLPCNGVYLNKASYRIVLN
ncbi:pentatricopeptide repeat-containing protein At5g18475-like [Juglans microcarpa x Juglans regia]|uniref:pentatricopeptide repeat-containing protein At5g18475-like n=1 Tax=Juglans microcarpa x Juglans regia TaxID=2249226 RepID=UPI001B7DD5B1|nr:pentatricopeptide repeat-containing protein At5g18475-like [Juglans microcarpa x Juglans regia]